MNILDYTEVKYIINCLGVSEYRRSDLEKLQLMLATLIHANYDDIFVSGLKSGCSIVTMMIRNCLIPTLKALYTPEKLTLTCDQMQKLSLKHKIVKVMIQDEVVYPHGRSWVIINLSPSNTSSVNTILYSFFPRILHWQFLSMLRILEYIV